MSTFGHSEDRLGLGPAHAYMFLQGIKQELWETHRIDLDRLETESGSVQDRLRTLDDGWAEMDPAARGELELPSSLSPAAARVERAIENARQTLGITATSTNFFGLVNPLVRFGNPHMRFLVDTIRELYDPEGTDVHRLIDLLNDDVTLKQRFEQFLAGEPPRPGELSAGPHAFEAITQLREELYGALASNRLDPIRDRDYLWDLLGRASDGLYETYDEDRLRAQIESRVPTIRFGSGQFDALGRPEQFTMTKPGLILNTAGTRILHAIMTARESVEIGMFQVESAPILKAIAYAQQRLMGLGYADKAALFDTPAVRMMVTPPTQRRKDGLGAAGVGWMNVLAHKILGATVLNDPDVLAGKADYAHYKFIAVDIGKTDMADPLGTVHRNPLAEYERRKFRVLLGSFNLTLGALGRVIDGESDLYTKQSYNLEAGFELNYGLVDKLGMQVEFYDRLIREARLYRDWLFSGSTREFGRNWSYEAAMELNNQRPLFFMTGIQTATRIKEALGFTHHSIDYRTGRFVDPFRADGSIQALRVDNSIKTVEAFFTVNVMTPEGDFAQVIDRTLQAYPGGGRDPRTGASKVTIFVTEGMKGLRNQNIGGTDGALRGSAAHDIAENKALQQLATLKLLYGDRLQIVEVGKNVHAKMNIVRRQYQDGRVEWDVITGSPNKTLQGEGGWARDLSVGFRSIFFRKDGKNPDPVEQMALTSLSYLYSLSPTAVGPEKKISPHSNAATKRIQRELALRLNPELRVGRSVRIQDYRAPSTTGLGDRITIGSIVTLELELRDSTDRKLGRLELLKFRVQEYGDGRLFLPDFGKIIDPVLAVPHKRLVGDRIVDGRAIEYSPGAVMAAFIDHLVTELNFASKRAITQVEEQLGLDVAHREPDRGRLMDYVRSTGTLGNALRKQADQYARVLLAHAENPPISRAASKARTFLRVVYGMMTRDMSGVREKTVQDHYNEITKALVTPGDQRHNAMMLSLKTADLPELTIEAADTMLHMQRALDQALENVEKPEIRGMSPPRYITRFDQDPHGRTLATEADARYFLLSNSIDHEGPARLVMAEALNLLAPTSYDPKTGRMSLGMKASKLDQTIQRLKNLMGADNSDIAVNRHVHNLGDTTLYFKNRYKGDKALEDPGHRWNIMLVAGMGENAWFNAATMRGFTKFEERPFIVKIHDSNLLAPQTGEIELFGGRMVLDGRTGTWKTYDIVPGKGRVERPDGVLHIGPDEARLHLMAAFSHGQVNEYSRKNPIFGVEGGEVVVHGIETYRPEGMGFIEHRILLSRHEPHGSGMRMLSKGMKAVAQILHHSTFQRITGSFVGSLRNLENNPRKNRLGGVEIQVLNETTGKYEAHNYDVGFGTGATITGLWNQTSRIFGLTSQKHAAKLSPEQYYQALDHMKIHMMVGENLFKANSIFLQTGTFLLMDAEWQRGFLQKVTGAKGSLYQFQGLLGRLEALATNTMAEYERGDLKRVQEKMTQSLPDRVERSIFGAIHDITGGQGEIQQRIRTLRAEAADLGITAERHLRDHFDRLVTELNAVGANPARAMRVLEEKPLYKMLAMMAFALHASQHIQSTKGLNQAGVDAFSRITYTLGRQGARYPETLFGSLIPLTGYESISSQAVTMSGRETANFPTMPTGEHATIVLQALTRHREAIERTRRLAELDRQRRGQLAGITPHGKTYVQGSGQEAVLKMQPIKIVGMYAGIHFDPIAFMRHGHDNARGIHALKKLWQITQEIQHHKYMDESGQLDQAKLAKAQRRAENLVKILGKLYGSSQNPEIAPQFVSTTSGMDHELQTMFQLQAEVGQVGKVYRIPYLTFGRYEAGSNTYQTKDLKYHDLSLLAPKTVLAMESYDEHQGNIMRTQGAIERALPVFRMVYEEFNANQGRISAQTRHLYEQAMQHVMMYDEHVKAALATDLQKSFGAVQAAGFAMIPTMVSGFEHLVIKGKGKKSRTIDLHETVVLGADAMARMVGQGLKAEQDAWRFIGEWVAGQKSESDTNVLKLKGVLVDGSKVRMRPGSSGRYLVMPEFFKNTQSEATNRFMREISNSWNALQDLKRQRTAIVNEEGKFGTRIRALQEEIAEKRKLLHTTVITPDQVALQAEITALNNRLQDLVHGRSEAFVKLNAKHKTMSYYIEGNIHNWDTVIKGMDADIALVERGLELISLKAQRHLINQRIGTNYNAFEKLNKVSMALTERINKLATTQQDRARVDDMIKEHQARKKALKNPADIKSWQKRMNVLEAIRLEYAPMGNKGWNDDREIAEALKSVGIRLENIAGERAGMPTLGFGGQDASLDAFLTDFGQTMSAGKIVSQMQQRTQLWQQMHGALTRAGTPQGTANVVGLKMIDVREWNFGAKQAGMGYIFDEQASRRSIYMHMHGMALFLGDYDGDNVIAAAMSRYVFLQRLQEGMGQYWGAFSDWAKDPVNQRALAEAGYQDMAQMLGGPAGKAGFGQMSLDQQLVALRRELTGGAKRAFIAHAERFIGMGSGTIAKTTQNFYRMSDDEWSKLGAREQEKRMMTIARRLNRFANDLHSDLEDEIRKEILRVEGDGGFVAGETSLDPFAAEKDTAESRLRKSHNQKIRNAVGRALRKDGAADFLVKTALAAGIDSFSLDHDTLLEYAVKTTFASTKLIGMYTNTQYILDAFNSSAGMLTQTSFQKSAQIIDMVAKAHGGLSPEMQTRVDAWETRMHVQVEKDKAVQAEITGRVSGFLQALQQESRNAIKLKDMAAAMLLKKDMSPLAQLLGDDLIKAVTLPVEFMTGKSVLGESSTLFNHNSKHMRAVFEELSVDQMVKIVVDDKTGKIKRAKWIGDRTGSSHTAWVFQNVIQPLIDAGNKMSQNRVNLMAQSDNARREQVQHQMDLETNASLTLMRMIETHHDYQDFTDYKNLVRNSSDHDFELKRHDISDQVKLQFVHKEMMLGRLKGTRMIERVMTDLIEKYIEPEGNMNRILEDANQIDATGKLAISLELMFYNYRPGESTEPLFRKMSDPRARAAVSAHHEALYQLGKSLTDATGFTNPVGAHSTEYQRGLVREEVRKAGTQAQRVLGSQAAHTIMLGGFGAWMFMPGTLHMLKGMADPWGIRNAPEEIIRQRENNADQAFIEGGLAMSLIGQQQAMMMQIATAAHNPHDRFVEQITLAGGLAVGHVAQTFAAQAKTLASRAPKAVLESAKTWNAMTAQRRGGLAGLVGMAVTHPVVQKMAQFVGDLFVPRTGPAAVQAKLTTAEIRNAPDPATPTSQVDVDRAIETLGGVASDFEEMQEVMLLETDGTEIDQVRLSQADLALGFEDGEGRPVEAEIQRAGKDGYLEQMRIAGESDRAMFNRSGKSSLSREERQALEVARLGRVMGPHAPR